MISMDARPGLVSHLKQVGKQAGRHAGSVARGSGEKKNQVENKV